MRETASHHHLSPEPWQQSPNLSLLCFPLTTYPPHRSLSGPLKCNMNLSSPQNPPEPSNHIRSKIPNLYHGLKARRIWLSEASKFIFWYCLQIRQPWRDFLLSPSQISNCSTSSHPCLSILTVRTAFNTTWPWLYYLQPILATYGSYAL